MKYILAFLLVCCVVNGQQFPNSIAGPNALLNATNFYSASVSSNVLSTDFTINISPSSVNGSINPPAAVTIDLEVIKICAATTSILTVCSGGRGFDSSTATAHAVSATVKGSLVAAHHNQLASEITSIETTLGTNLSNLSKVITNSGDFRDISIGHATLPHDSVNGDPTMAIGSGFGTNGQFVTLYTNQYGLNTGSSINLVNDTGTTNAAAGVLKDSSGSLIPLNRGLRVCLYSLHGLQAGSNTFNLNSTGALPIVSHRTMTNIGSAYVRYSVIELMYVDGSNVWVDVSQ